MKKKMDTDKALGNTHTAFSKVLDEAYGFDKTLAKGKWFTTKKGIRVKLAYSNEESVLARVNEINMEKLAENDGEPLDEQDHFNTGYQVFKERVLIDWELDIECTDSNIDMVRDNYPEFINECIRITQNNQNFREKVVEETVGN